MSDYRRLYIPNYTYFFTLVTHNRKTIFNDINNIHILKKSINTIQHKYPFKLDAIVILPDHLHMLMKMPEHDCDYSTRIRLIKHDFSRKLYNLQPIWQSRFWEHCIRNECDYFNHMNYIHYNPVKHRYVSSAKQWPFSSFMKWVKNGYYQINWGCVEPKYLPDVPE